MNETFRKAIKQPEGWFDARVQKHFKSTGYETYKPCTLGSLDEILKGREPSKEVKIVIQRERPFQQPKFRVSLQPYEPIKIMVKRLCQILLLFKSLNTMKNKSKSHVF